MVAQAHCRAPEGQSDLSTRKAAPPLTVGSHKLPPAKPLDLTVSSNDNLGSYGERTNSSKSHPHSGLRYEVRRSERV